MARGGAPHPLNGLPDRGPIAIAYTDVVGSTALTEALGDGAAHAAISNHNGVVRANVERCGGAELKSLGDGFELAFPTVQQAVECALAIQRSFELGADGSDEAAAIRVRVGIHHGEVIREAGEILGRTAILAQRVMTVAEPGGILLSSEAKDALMSGIAGYRLVERGRYSLKGIERGVELFEVVWRPASVDGRTPALVTRPAREPPFVGRRDSLRRMDEAMQAAARGSLRIVALTGEAGIGKSRLMREFLENIGRRGPPIGLARCRPEARGPFQSLAECVRGWQLADEPGWRRRAEESLAPLAPFAPELAPSAAARGGHPTDELRSDHRERLIEEMTTSLLEACTSRTRVLCFDDLQWADSHSIDALRSIVRRTGLGARGPNLLIVASCRSSDVEADHPTRALLSDLQRDRRFVSIALEGLKEDEIRTLVRALPGGDRGSVLTTQLAGRSEGNPFFLEELFLDAAEHGRAPGRVEAVAAVPPRVQEVVERRLGRLGEDCLATLRTAALIGSHFSLRTLESVTGATSESEPRLTEDGLTTQLELACAARILREEEAGDDIWFRFEHGLLTEALAQQLGRARRKRLDVRIAAALEADSQAGVHVAASDIAFRLLRAGRWAPREKLLHWCVRAGDEAAEVSAYDDAATLYQAVILHLAAAAPETAAELAGLRAKLFRALARTGRVEEATVVADEAIGGFEALGEHRLADEARLSIAMLLGLHARYRSSLPHLEKILSSANSREPDALMGRALARYTIALDQVGHAERANETAQRLLTLAHKLGDAQLEERARNVQRNVYVNQTPRFGRALVLTRRLVESARARGDAAYVATYRGEAAFLELLVGRLDRAEETARTALAEAEATGTIAEMVNAHAVRALVYCYRASWDRLEEEWEIAAPRLREVPGALRVSLLVWARRRADYWRGGKSDRLPSISKVYRGMELAEIAVLASRALVLSELAPQTAYPAVAEAAAALPRERGGLSWLIAAQAIAASATNLNDRELAAPWFERLLAYRGTFYMGSTTLELARIARICEEPDACRTQLDSAIRSFRRERLPPFLTTALIERARLASAVGGTEGSRRARRSLDEARELAEANGLLRHVEEIGEIEEIVDQRGHWR